MEQREIGPIERVQGAELHPRHAAWARIATQSTLIGFVIFLVLAGLFVLFIQVRF
jgi:hypothetical protein